MSNIIDIHTYCVLVCVSMYTFACYIIFIEVAN